MRRRYRRSAVLVTALPGVSLDDPLTDPTGITYD